MNRYCGGCGASTCRPECSGSFARQGIVKIHWECWAACNLTCSFCYRTKQKPLSHDDAVTLLRIAWSSGAQWITFAGGDPSIRPGVVPLIHFANELGLKVEVQTNAQEMTADFKSALIEVVDQVGLSIDGENAAAHDSFRSCPGNFAKVTQLLSDLNDANVDTTVRTVVALGNHESISAIANILKPHKNVRRWSLLEFTPLNDGAKNRSAFDLAPEEFRIAVAAAISEAAGEINVDGFGNIVKSGVYAVVSPAGELYGTVPDGLCLSHRFIGNLLTNHLHDLAIALPFDAKRHQLRYGESSTTSGTSTKRDYGCGV